jgi:hypothetical protein
VNPDYGGNGAETHHDHGKWRIVGRIRRCGRDLCNAGARAAGANPTLLARCLHHRREGTRSSRPSGDEGGSPGCSRSLLFPHRFKNQSIRSVGGLCYAPVLLTGPEPERTFGACRLLLVSCSQGCRDCRRAEELRHLPRQSMSRLGVRPAESIISAGGSHALSRFEARIRKCGWYGLLVH